MARFSYFGRLTVALLALLTCGLLNARAQDSLNVERLGQVYDNWAIAEAVKVDGHYLYVAANWAGLRVYDITDRTHPVEIATLQLNGNCSGIDIAGTTAYVCVGTRLVCVDISVRTAPQLLGQVDTPGAAHDLVYRTGHVYLADGLGGLRIVDVTDPQTPSVIGSAATRNEAFGIDLSGQYIFVADYESGLSIFDATDLTNPVLLGETDNNPGFTDVIVYDGIVFAAADDGLHIVDVTDPAVPQELGVFADAQHAQALAVRWPLIFVDCHYHGLYALDCSDADSPSVFGYLDAFEWEAWGMDCDSTHAYLAAGYSGVRVIQAAEMNSVWEVGFADTDYLQTSTIVDHYAYVAAGNYGLNVVDIADARHPVQVAALDLDGMTINSVAVGNRLYTASFYNLSVIDISDPSAPVWLNTINTLDVIWWLEYSAPYLYVASGFGGLHTYDLADPDHPVDISSVGADYQLWSITVGDGYACGTAGVDGLVVYDLGDSAHPSQVAQFATGGSALFAAVSGDRAYVSVEDRGVAVIDISVPASPALIRRVTTRGFAGEVHVAGGLLYVADMYAGVSIYSLWDRDLPQLVAFYDTPGNAVGLTIVDTLVYVADWLHFGVYAHAGGLAVDEQTTPALPQAPALRSCYPNPFNAQLQIEYELPQAASVTLTIHDLLGRETAVLASGALPAGLHTVSWDARDAASGVYLVTLVAGDYRATQKVCLVK